MELVINVTMQPCTRSFTEEKICSTPMVVWIPGKSRQFRANYNPLLSPRDPVIIQFTCGKSERICTPCLVALVTQEEPARVLTP